MLKALFESICRTAVQSSETRVVHLPGKDGYALRDGLTGKTEHFPAPVLPRCYQAYSLDDFTAMVRAQEDNSTVVFVGRQGLIAVLDERGKRREALGMNLPHSHAFAVLRACERDRKPFTHKDFVRFLRIDLTDGIEPSVLSVLSTLSFARSEDGASTVKVGGESLSRAAKAAAYAGGQPIPEEIIVTTPVYQDLVGGDWRCRIRCALDLNLSAEAFTLIPLAGELEEAQRETDAKIKDTVAAELGTSVAGVFCGSPEAWPTPPHISTA